MGYLTYFTGQIDIDPPLQYHEFKDIDFKNQDVALAIEEITRETDTGEEIIKCANAIIPASIDSYKGYKFLPDLEALVFLFGKDHKFSGEIRAEGENAADIRRYVVAVDSPENPRVVELRPKIVWPDGEEEIYGD